MTWNPSLVFNRSMKKLVTVKEDQQTDRVQWKTGRPISSHKVSMCQVWPTVSLLSTCPSLCYLILGLEVCKLPFQGFPDCWLSPDGRYW